MKNLDDRIKGILEDKELLTFSKLIVVAATVYNPVTVSKLSEIFGCTQTGAPSDETIVKGLIPSLLGKYVYTVTKNDVKIFPIFNLGMASRPEKEKGNVIPFSPKTDGDVELFVKVMEEVLGEEPSLRESLTKKQLKLIKTVVQFINGVIKSLSITKREAYHEYLMISLHPHGKFWRDSFKCLNYPYNRKTWKGRVENPVYTGTKEFEPVFLNPQETQAFKKFYGIDVSIIPADPKSSPFYTTVWLFLLSKPKTHPVCAEVLHALERIIAFSLFRKENVSELLSIHKEYKRKYLEAKESGKLETLAEYIKRSTSERTEKEKCS